MYIAFKCYDFDGDKVLDKQEVKMVLKNIPLIDTNRHKLVTGTEEPLFRGEYHQLKIRDTL